MAKSESLDVSYFETSWLLEIFFGLILTKKEPRLFSFSVQKSLGCSPQSGNLLFVDRERKGKWIGGKKREQSGG